MKKKSFVRRALVSIFLVSMLAVGVSSFIFFWQEREMALDYAKTLQSEELSWSKSIIDQNINIADELFKGLQADRSLFQLIKNFDSKKRSPTATNREFKEIVSSHLPYTNQIHAVQLFRSDFVLYSKNPTLASIYNTKNVEFIMKAQNTDHVFWVPTYDFTKAYNHTLIQNYPIKHRWIFSLVGKMEPYSFNQSRLEYLSDTTERPILAISFNEEWLMNCLPERKYPNAVSFIVNDTGEYLTHTQRDLLGEPVLEELADVFKKEREKGEEKIEYNKQQNLLFFNTLDNGWKIATLVPMEDILADAIRGIYQPFFIVTPIIALLCLLLSWSISRALSKPLRQLTAAIKQVEHGDFDVFLPDTHDEFSLVMNSYNSMTKRIEELIEENYQTRNHEQEKEMMALRYQTNPHFL